MLRNNRYNPLLDRKHYRELRINRLSERIEKLEAQKLAAGSQWQEEDAKQLRSCKTSLNRWMKQIEAEAKDYEAHHSNA